MRYLRVIYLLISGILCLGFQLHAQEDNSDLLNSVFDLSMDELMDLEIYTASNNIENLSDAPATTIVITEQEIKSRGYFKLFDVLNDLPGFDLSRSFGDDQFYAYARGYRKTTSDQMLLMVDGIRMNHLYNNNMNAFFQYPLNNIKQIEILYGPASAIYGPNAFSGVINIITKKEGKSMISSTMGSANTNMVDLYVNQSGKDLNLNLSGRIYQSDGFDFSNRTPMLAKELYTNPYLWGDFSQTRFSGYNSPAFGSYLYPRITYKGLTFGMINFFYESGLGSEFAGGTSLNAGTWRMTENSFFTQYEANFGKLKSRSLLRYRRSDIPGSAGFIRRNYEPGSDTISLAPGGQIVMNLNDTVTNNKSTDQTYVIDINTQSAENWQASNGSYSYYHDFTYPASENLIVNFGVKYEHRILNRDYNINSNVVTREYLYLLSDTLRTKPQNPAIQSSMKFPDLPADNRLDQGNHHTLTDRGIYAQAKYNPGIPVTFFGGIRYDYNSIWKDIISPRMGVVIKPNKYLVSRAFFGTAFLEPSARILYGGWAGSVSNENLVPEKLRTIEVSTSYTRKTYSIGVNAYANYAPDAIGQDINNVPINLGERRMLGVEVNGKLLLKNQGKTISRVRSDLYISYINSQENLSGSKNYVPTGNMAPIKIRSVLSMVFSKHLILTMQNRYIGKISTVQTNPIPSIDPYFISDLYFLYDDILIDGLSIGFKTYNLFDVDYFHPGYRAADAGETDPNYALLNSSWYNSRLPQPGRNFLITLQMKF